VRLAVAENGGSIKGKITEPVREAGKEVLSHKHVNVLRSIGDGPKSRQTFKMLNSEGKKQNDLGGENHVQEGGN